MDFFLYLISFIFVFQRINSFLIVSMIVKKVDDCIKKIELDDGTNLYERDENSLCDYSNGNNLDYNIPIFEPIPYELGQKIKIVIGDKGRTTGNVCGFNMDVFVNNKTINNMSAIFWGCDNCIDFLNNYENNMLNCFPPQSISEANNYNFYFNLSSLDQLDFDTSEYFYYLKKENNIYISSSDFNNAINLIDLYSSNNLYAKNLICIHQIIYMPKTQREILFHLFMNIYIINYLLMNLKHIKENL